MLRTRLWMGTLLGILGIGIVVLDQWLTPWYPFLFVSVMGIGWAASRELLSFSPPQNRPVEALCLSAVLIVILGNWFTAVQQAFPHRIPAEFSTWQLTAILVIAAVMAFFLSEMARFHGSGLGTTRVMVGTWIVAYVGLFGSCLIQLRFLDGSRPLAFSLPLAVVFFVPKAGDIGAYTVGRIMGRHRFSPLLSPKKTWEGAVGGFCVSIGVTLLLLAIGTGLARGWGHGILFGAAIAVAAQLGDLAESMIKRDSHVKDAGGSLPGFGGILDLIDSILFAAPVVYVWWVVIGVD